MNSAWLRIHFVSWQQRLEIIYRPETAAAIYTKEDFYAEMPDKGETCKSRCVIDICKRGYNHVANTSLGELGTSSQHW